MPRQAEVAPRTWLRDALGRTTLVAGALGVLALAVRLPLIGHHVAVDETSTVAFAQRSFRHMTSLLVDYEGNAIPYYMLAHPLYRIGEDVAALRTLSVIAGTLAVVALVQVGTQLVGRRVALIGALLLSVNAFAVLYSVTARPYALGMLVTVLAYGALVAALRGEPRAGWLWLAYAPLMTLAFYLNSLSAGLILLAQAVLVLRGGRPAVRRWLLAVAGIVACVIPLAVISLRIAGERDPFYWVRRPGIDDLARGQVFVFGGLLPAAICLVLLVVTVVAVRRDIPRSLRGLVTHRYAGVVAWAFAPIVVLFLGSQARPYFTELYLTASVPAACLVVALCLDRLAPTLATVLTGALVVACLATVLLGLPPGHDQDDWDGAFEHVAAIRQPGDHVLLDTALALQPGGYYDDTFTAGGRLVVPQWKDTAVPDAVMLLQNPGSYYGVPEGPPTREQLQRLVEPTGRGIVMFTHIVDQGDYLHEAGMAWARASCDVDVRHFRSIDVVGISRCSGS